MTLPRVTAWPAMALVGLLRLYQMVVSPWRGATCRYYPSCSNYAIVAFKRFGLVRGLGLTVWRLLRCNPWSPGGVDHVPEVWELEHGCVEVSHELV